jgi:hypothetical protein
MSWTVVIVRPAVGAGSGHSVHARWIPPLSDRLGGSAATRLNHPGPPSHPHSARLDAVGHGSGERNGPRASRWLREIEPESLLSRTAAGSDFSTPMDPVGRTFEACSDELRSESGSPSDGDSILARTKAIHEHALSQDGWMAVYEEALMHYRAEAAKAIRAWLDGFDPAAQASKSGK